MRRVTDVIQNSSQATQAQKLTLHYSICRQYVQQLHLTTYRAACLVKLVLRDFPGVLSYQFHRLTTLIIHHPITLSFQAYNLPSLQILHTVAFLFFSRTDSTDSPDCLRVLLMLSFFTRFPTFWFHAVMKLTYVSF